MKLFLHSERRSSIGNSGAGYIDVADLKRRMGETCAACGLPTRDHFRGRRGVRFEGCKAARIKEPR